MAPHPQDNPQRSNNTVNNPTMQPEIAILQAQIQLLTEQNQTLIKALTERVNPVLHTNHISEHNHPSQLNQDPPPPPPSVPGAASASRMAVFPPKPIHTEEEEVASHFSAPKKPEQTHQSQIQALKEQLDQVQQQLQTKTPNHPPTTTKSDSPFSPEILTCPLPIKFKLPTIKPFDGTTDPLDHLESFKSFMTLHATPDEIMCRAFPTTLTGSARVWFSNLQPSSVTNFTQLGKSFVDHFIGGQRHRKPATYLISVKQREDETLREFVARFNSEAVNCEGVDDKVSLTAIMAGLKKSNFLFSLHKNPPKTMAELMVKAQKYINAEEAEAARPEPQHQTYDYDSRKRKEPETRSQQNFQTYSQYSRAPLPDRPPFQGRSRHQNNNQNHAPEPGHNYRSYTPLNTTRDKILMQIQTYPELKWPRTLATPSGRRDHSKYCHFHRDHGHDTINCFQLKNQIEELIRGGRLARFVRQREEQADQRRPEIDRPQGPNNDLPPQRNPIGEIRVISGGLGGGGDSSGSRKAHARSARAAGVICTVDRPHKILKSAPPLTFTEEDAVGIQHPHDDPLVISAVIANYNIRRILIDNGSSADVIFLSTFAQIGIEKTRLAPVRSPLSGFAGDRIMPLGVIQLPLTLGTDPIQATKMVDFLVVDCPSTYNVILGRGTLNKFRAVTSTYHLLLRFPVGDKIGEARGDQQTARECYAASLKSPASRETMLIDNLEVRDEEELQMGEPAEALEEVRIDPTDQSIPAEW